jgi:prolyl-tRNA synthetase
MSHSDDKGLVLPPMIAPYQIIFIPLWKTDEEKQKVQHAID